jgi:hypothetical protein
MVHDLQKPVDFRHVECRGIGDEQDGNLHGGFSAGALMSSAAGAAQLPAARSC